jgi:2-(1,2-epoxy-1,2-dihydrophenyl)acetyl-CoA isomerase
MTETVLYQVKNRVATLTLNRPQSRNAMNHVMRLELIEKLDNALADDEVRVIVLTASGPVFSSGADIKEDMGSDFLPQVELEKEFKPSLMRIATGSKPVIGAINGPAAGIAAAYALACDLCVMTDSASIYMAFAHIGFIPDGGITWQLLQNMGRCRAYELIAMGGHITAQECLQYGFANRVVPVDQLADTVQILAEQLAEQAPLALHYAKQALYKVKTTDLDDAITIEAGMQNYCVRSQDGREGVTAFLQKRKPVYQGK